MSDETIREKARRLADVEIAEAHIHPHSPMAAILHMRILRSLMTQPMFSITPEVAREVVIKSTHEMRHHRSTLAFLSETQGESEEL